MLKIPNFVGEIINFECSSEEEKNLHTHNKIKFPINFTIIYL